MKTNGNGNLQYQPPATAPTDPAVSSPGILVETLSHQLWIVVAATALTAIGTFLYLDRVTPLYTSTARLYVEQEIPKVILDSEEGVMSRLDNYLYTQAEVLRSSPVLTYALDSLDVEQMQTFSEVDGRMSTLYGGLETEVGKMDGIINISFKALRPTEAAAIVNAVVNAYVVFQSEQKRGTAAALLRILEEARIQRGAEVTGKHQRMLEFKRENASLAFGSDQDNIVLRHMERLLVQQSEATVATRQAKSLYETGQAMAKDPAALRQLLEARRGWGIDTAAMNEMASLQAELKVLERDKANALLELKPDHPAIAALDTGIARTQRRMKELDQMFVRRQLAVLRQEYLDATVRKEELEKQCEAQRRQVLLRNAQQGQYAALQSVYEEAKKGSDMIADRIKELNVTEEVGGLTVTILERAQAASVPSEPKKARIMAIALLLGACAGVGLGLVREASDQRLRSSQEISALLGLPVLGAIPAMRSPLRSGILRAQMVRVCPTSPGAEAFRRLRTPLLLGLNHEKVKTIVITSPGSGEGKTLVASNLALALAQAGQKVLIVDADCHAPRLHKIFNKDRHTKGLTAVLTGQMTLEDAIEPTGVNNLDILTCGPEESNLTGIFSSVRLISVVATLADEYDRVLIDSPPVLSATEAQVLAAQCDASVLVLRAETSTRQDSVQACGELVGVNARILGIVVDAVPGKHSRYHYNGYYSYSHSITAVPASDNGNSDKGNSDKEDLPLELLFERKCR